MDFVGRGHDRLDRNRLRNADGRPPIWACPGTESSEPGGDCVLRRVVRRDVATYDRLGPHPTGTDGNLSAAKWLESEFAGLGYRVRLQRRGIPTYLVDEAFVEVRGERIQAFPQFPVPRPDAHELMGTLGDQIPILRIPNRLTNNSLAQAELQARIRGVAASGAKAVILEVAGACGDIKTLNAPLGIEPWDAPVLLVAGGDAERLALLGEQAETARVRLMGRHTIVDSINMIAEIGPASAPAIVVSTPLSGWFHATAERGSGIAAFLSLARWASAEHGRRRFIFTANSGHELGDAGAHAFLDSEAPPPERTQLWLHIGANVGSRNGEEPERASSPSTSTQDTDQSWVCWARGPSTIASTTDCPRSISRQPEAWPWALPRYSRLSPVADPGPRAARAWRQTRR